MQHLEVAGADRAEPEHRRGMICCLGVSLYINGNGWKVAVQRHGVRNRHSLCTRKPSGFVDQPVSKVKCTPPVARS